MLQSAQNRTTENASGYLGGAVTSAVNGANQLTEACGWEQIPHLRHVLLSYISYYNGTRTHLSLNKDALPDQGSRSSLW
ncbi:hypothetical protein [Nitrobacter sp. TKz-YC02]|uniref:hypothetical protein n=1 Tax=Nitrobacter sp. TKz-YC02 TaxID=3398704 RepID=UPI003CEE57FB